MKFTIITHAEHKLKGDTLYAYEPYVREMNLWLKNVSEVKIVAPISFNKVCAIDSEYAYKKIDLEGIASFNVTTLNSSIKAILKIPIILFQIYKAMQWADHIHLRCPGNIGLLGCLVQILFPSKPKTVKYAGNWDPKSKQPLSYKIQKWIVSNTFFTRNCKVLVYGEWPNQSENIVPFFTASYSEKEKRDNEVNLNKEDIIKFIFVGGFTKGKQPLLSVEVVHQLKLKGYQVELNMYGDGVERINIEKYLLANNLKDTVFLHGNSDKETVKKAYQKAHFLVFISKSEGWPKVVAEAMFWGCLPITSRVSCIPFMLDHGKRGAIVNDNKIEIIEVIENYLQNKSMYKQHVLEAEKWSRTYTLEKFETEIKKLLL